MLAIKISPLENDCEYRSEFTKLRDILFPLGVERVFAGAFLCSAPITTAQEQHPHSLTGQGV
jgi:hypothetical protein